VTANGNAALVTDRTKIGIAYPNFVGAILNVTAFAIVVAIKRPERIKSSRNVKLKKLSNSFCFESFFVKETLFF
jgi:uncharacterized membrane protein